MKDFPTDLRPGEPVLVSACLLGEVVSWDGRSHRAAELLQALEEAGAVPVSVCPEMLGGLPVPRPAAEAPEGDGRDVWRGEIPILTVESGEDVTAQFLRGACATLAAARSHGVRYAFMAERSPSCGVLQTHSAGTVVDGPGVTTAALEEAGIRVFAGD